MQHAAVELRLNQRGDGEHEGSRPQAVHSAAQRKRRGAKGSPLEAAGGLGRSPHQHCNAAPFE